MVRTYNLMSFSIVELALFCVGDDDML